MKPSLAATFGPHSFTWNLDDGFTGPLADEMNLLFSRHPLITIEPRAALAREVLLDVWPGAEITEFNNPAQPTAGPDAIV